MNPPSNSAVPAPVVALAATSSTTTMNDEMVIRYLQERGLDAHDIERIRADLTNESSGNDAENADSQTTCQNSRGVDMPSSSGGGDMDANSANPEDHCKSLEKKPDRVRVLASNPTDEDLKAHTKMIEELVSTSENFQVSDTAEGGSDHFGAEAQGSKKEEDRNDCLENNSDALMNEKKAATRQIETAANAVANNNNDIVHGQDDDLAVKKHMQLQDDTSRTRDGQARQEAGTSENRAGRERV